MTTTSTAAYVPFRDYSFLHTLTGLFTLVASVSAFHSEMVGDWILENLLVAVLLIALIASYRWLPFSQLSYLLIFLFLCLHEWGAHYKYADVPLGEWIKQWLHTTRNHYDRVVHFAFGLLLFYPIREVFVRKARVRGFWGYYIAVDVIVAFSACYEMLEALVASIVSPQAGDAFVGMQGDIWDSQKDMFMGLLGGIIAALITASAKTTVLKPAN